jgi:two-component system sensor histidine kinase BaeS
MRFGLRTKLTVSFAATALICVLLIGIFSNIQLEKHFRDYIQQNQNKQNKEIAGLISAKIQADGSWDESSIQDIGVYAMEQGLILQVKDANGGMIWDAYAYNQGMCQQMIQDMSRNMVAGNPGWNGKLTIETIAMAQGAVNLGTVDIAYYGPYFYNDIDMHFIKTLNGIFIGVGIFSLLLAFAFGVLLSQRISLPISRVIHAAQSIGKGMYGARIHVNSSTTEIVELSDTVNQLAESLESQEKLRKRLTGDVAHELRTPLATLQTHLETMIDGIWEPTTQRLESCHEEILRISRLVSDLEKLAQYDSDTLVLEKKVLPLEPFLRSLLKTYETTFDQKGIRTIIDCDESILLADKDKMSQVIINLVSNALKFTPEDGIVTIKARHVPDKIHLTFSDTGTGIPAKDLPHIFERFYRADVSRNRTTGGSGIGLALVKAIIEAHGGTISVLSEEGKGTTFTMELPAEQNRAKS